MQITSPTAGQILSDNKPIQLIARATDRDGTVALVNFYANDTLIGTVRVASTGGTYKFSWRVSLRRTTKYRIQARATDNRGATALSQVVTVTIVP